MNHDDVSLPEDDRLWRATASECCPLSDLKTAVEWYLGAIPADYWPATLEMRCFSGCGVRLPQHDVDIDLVEYIQEEHSDWLDEEDVMEWLKGVC